MAAPGLLGYADPARTNDQIVGPLATSFAFIAIWEVTRSLRRVNVGLGLWLLAAPWVLGYAVTPALNSTVIGLLLIGFARVQGKIRQRIGGGWAALWSSPPGDSYDGVKS